MKRKWILATVVAPLLWLAAGPAQAFECPKHIAEAQAAIDKASESTKQMRSGMPLASRSHLRHAKMSLVEARYHHTQSGNFHHARSIVRAHEGLGHALTASILSQRNSK
jgi:hypothetical protein